MKSNGMDLIGVYLGKGVENMDGYCIDNTEEPDEIDVLIDKVIEEAEMEDMVNFAEMRDEVIENVADILCDIGMIEGIEAVKHIIRKELKVNV
jgi:hypothetical protein